MSESGSGEPVDSNAANDKDSSVCPTCGNVYDTERGVKLHHARAHDESLAGKKVECHYCGKTYRETPSRIERAKRNYCSTDCYDEDKSERMAGENNPAYDGGGYVECEWCGDEFWLKPSLDYKYCSHSCSAKAYHDESEQHHNYNSQIVSCETCGSELERTEYRINRQENHFCNESCYGEYKQTLTGEDSPGWKGGFSPNYGPDWEEKREKARERDDYTCQDCGVTESELGKELDVHHIRPLRVFKEEYDDPKCYELANKLDNLISYCSTCHARWEGIPLRVDKR